MQELLVYLKKTLFSVSAYFKRKIEFIENTFNN